MSRGGAAGSRTTTPKGTPGAGSAGRHHWYLNDAGIAAVETDLAVRWPTVRRSVIAGMRRRGACIRGVAGMTTSAPGRAAECLGALARVAAAAAAVNRDAAEIELFPVTKFHPVSDVAILWHLGCRSFG